MMKPDPIVSERQFFSSVQYFLVRIFVMKMSTVPGYIEHMRIRRLTRSPPHVIGWKHESNSQMNQWQCNARCPKYLRVFPLLVGFSHSFDKDHANTAFLHKFRGTVYAMAQGEDLLDREASFYSAVLTPVIFLQQYRDTWCLLERFHRALRLYQISHPTEKRSALKILQNLRSITQKVRTFILAMQGPPVTRSTHPVIPDNDDYHDPKDSRYFKELIRSLG